MSQFITLKMKVAYFSKFLVSDLKNCMGVGIQTITILTFNYAKQNLKRGTRNSQNFKHIRFNIYVLYQNYYVYNTYTISATQYFRITYKIISINTSVSFSAQWCYWGHVPSGSHVNGILAFCVCVWCECVRDRERAQNQALKPVITTAGGGCSASRLCRFAPGERAPDTHWMGGWVSLGAGLGNMERWEFWSYRGSSSDPSVFRPVGSRCTDCAIPAPIKYHIRF
jgi:hypothetical protein